MHLHRYAFRVRATDAVGNNTPILCFPYGGAICPTLQHELYLPLAARAP